MHVGFDTCKIHANYSLKLFPLYAAAQTLSRRAWETSLNCHNPFKSADILCAASRDAAPEDSKDFA